MLQVLKDLWSALALSFQLQMVNNLDPLHRYRREILPESPKIRESCRMVPPSYKWVYKPH
jgi:hypothetical protein